MEVPHDERVSHPRRPRVMRRHPRGWGRSVDRGTHRPGIEPRKHTRTGVPTPYGEAEGETTGCVKASSKTTPRGLRPRACAEGLHTGIGRSRERSRQDGDGVRAVNPKGARRR
jgi:hypothetical protein